MNTSIIDMCPSCTAIIAKNISRLITSKIKEVLFRIRTFSHRQRVWKNQFAVLDAIRNLELGEVVKMGLPLISRGGDKDYGYKGDSEKHLP